MTGDRVWWKEGRQYRELAASLRDIARKCRIADPQLELIDLARRYIDQLWSAIEALPDPEADPAVKRPSKQDEVIAMLRRPEGATVDEVARATGWQRHTVRGVFSGTLKKKLGLTLASAKEERGRVYRVDRPASA